MPLFLHLGADNPKDHKDKLIKRRASEFQIRSYEEQSNTRATVGIENQRKSYQAVSCKTMHGNAKSKYEFKTKGTNSTLQDNTTTVSTVSTHNNQEIATKVNNISPLYNNNTLSDKRIVSTIFSSSNYHRIPFIITSPLLISAYDCIVTIEHCWDCQNHCNYVWHDPMKYSDTANNILIAIANEFIRYQMPVRLIAYKVCYHFICVIFFKFYDDD